ncbi:hypothetical protein CIK90_09595 [Prevotella sp. P5-126]|nr:hypothetical protein CIK90_09595 [Prevotella sp. P5-126]OYP46776.1 hypothetical protein CIK96_05320 [Prevotella sp. P4-98]OYP68823.1 hypothetical protein CIK92_13055 [Prevotella sp. P4-67]
MLPAKQTLDVCQGRYIARAYLDESIGLQFLQETGDRTAVAVPFSGKFGMLSTYLSRLYAVVDATLCLRAIGFCGMTE